MAFRNKLHSLNNKNKIESLHLAQTFGETVLTRLPHVTTTAKINIFNSRHRDEILNSENYCTTRMRANHATHSFGN